MKRLFALALAIVLSLALAVPAAADPWCPFKGGRTAVRASRPDLPVAMLLSENPGPQV